MNRLTLVKRGRVARVGPWILKNDLGRGVGHRRREIATLEEGDIEAELEHVLQTIINVDPPVIPNTAMDSHSREFRCQPIKKYKGPRFKLTGTCQSILARRCGSLDRMKNGAQSTIQRSWKRRSAM